MIIARGYRVRLRLDDGRTVRLAGELLHDETGREIPRDTVLVAVFKKTNELVESPPTHVRKHFGSGRAMRGNIDLPPMAGGWKKIGDVAEIWYERRGEHLGPWHHAFKKMPTLYVRNGAYKITPLEWNWRGALS